MMLKQQLLLTSGMRGDQVLGGQFLCMAPEGPPLQSPTATARRKRPALYRNQSRCSTDGPATGSAALASIISSSHQFVLL